MCFYKIEKEDSKSLILKAFRPLINITCAPVVEISSALFSPAFLRSCKFRMKFNCIKFGFYWYPNKSMALHWVAIFFCFWIALYSSSYLSIKSNLHPHRACDTLPLVARRNARFSRNTGEYFSMDIQAKRARKRIQKVIRFSTPQIASFSHWHFSDLW